MDDNNYNNDFNSVNSVNKKVFVEEDAIIVDSNLDSDSNSNSNLDLNNDSTTTKQPKVGDDKTNIEDIINEVNVDDILMKCPECNANPIGTNCNFDTFRFALDKSPLQKSVIEARKLIMEVNKLLYLDIDDEMNEFNEDGSLTSQKRKQQQRPEGLLQVTRVKEYYYWRNKIRKKDKSMKHYLCTKKQ